MPTGLEEIRLRLFADRKQERKIVAVSVIVFAAVFLLALSILNGAASPLEALKGIFTGAGSGNLEEVILTLLAGAALALAGALYQTSLRNPIAVPTILGVDSGISLAQALMVAVLGSEVMSATGMYYASSYLAAGLVLALILLCGKASGGKRMSVVDMILAGVVINIMLEVLAGNVQGSMDESSQMVYEEVSEKAYAFAGLGLSRGMQDLLIVCAVIMVPVFAMRFSMNTISFDDGDGRCLGVRPGVMRVWALAAGTVLTATATIHYGSMGALSLLVPHLCRYAFGADTRKVFIASAFYGAFLMMVGWCISNAAFIGTYQVSVETILDMIALPLLLVFVARQKHGWG